MRLIRRETVMETHGERIKRRAARYENPAPAAFIFSPRFSGERRPIQWRPC